MHHWRFLRRSAAQIGTGGCGREHILEVALDARDAAARTAGETPGGSQRPAGGGIPELLVVNLGATLWLRRERRHLPGNSALKEPPNSCKDASHDPGYTVHDISLSTPRNVRVALSVR